MECEKTGKIRMLIMTGMTNAMNLLGHGGWQTKKLAYALVAVAGIVWLSVDLRLGIRSDWNAAFLILVGMVTGGYLGGKQIAKGQTNVDPK